MNNSWVNAISKHDLYYFFSYISCFCLSPYTNLTAVIIVIARTSTINAGLLLGLAVLVDYGKLLARTTPHHTISPYLPLRLNVVQHCSLLFAAKLGGHSLANSQVFTFFLHRRRHSLFYKATRLVCRAGDSFRRYVHTFVHTQHSAWPVVQSCRSRSDAHDLDSLTSHLYPMNM